MSQSTNEILKVKKDKHHFKIESFESNEFDNHFTIKLFIYY